MLFNLINFLLITTPLFLAACGLDQKGLGNKPASTSLQVPSPTKSSKPLPSKPPKEDSPKSNSSPTPIIDETVKNLIDKQNTNFPKIITELKRDKKKTSHWIWWVFPTEMPGASEPAPKTKVELSTVNELLKNADLEAWSDILEEIFSLLKASPIGPFKEVDNKPNKNIIPKIDHGRIHSDYRTKISSNLKIAA